MNSVIKKVIFFLCFSLIVFGFTYSTKFTHRATLAIDYPPFTFTAAGDWGQNASASATLNLIPTTNSVFTLALGDLSYKTTVGNEAAWCDYVKSKVGTTYPFELLAGDHENIISKGALIDNFANCLPDRMNATISPYGAYGREYYFDYQNARFFMLSPHMTDGIDPYEYVQNSNHLQWVKDNVRAAKADGKWVIVGTHTNCLTLGNKPCEAETLMNVLVQEKVDLILQGNDHGYQRSKQLTCIHPGVYNPRCTSDFDSRGGTYIQGKGTTVMIIASAGSEFYDLNLTDPEMPYFVSWMGKNANPRSGLAKFNLTNTGISVDFVGSSPGTFSDHFEIMSATPTISQVPELTTTGLLLADSTIKQNSPSKNFGTQISNQTDGSPLVDFLLKFQVNGLSGKQINRATLRIYNVDESWNFGGIAKSISSDWVESGTGSVTWNNAPLGTTLLASLGSVLPNTWYEMDVTPAIIGDGIYSFRISSLVSDGAAYASKENNLNIPQLVITYQDDSTPSPSLTPTPTPTPSPTPFPTFFTYSVAEDTNIKSTYPTRNYGTLGNVVVDGSPLLHGLMKFNLTNLSGKTITRATLHLFNIASAKKGGDFYTTDNNWSESIVTWDTAPTQQVFIAGLGPVTGTSTAPVEYQLDVTPAITGDGTVSFRYSSTSTEAAQYSTKEGPINLVPYLTVETN